MITKSRRNLIPAIAAVLLTGVSQAQPPQQRQSLSSDWTDQQVVFTESTDVWKAIRNQQDPRYVRKVLRDLLRQKSQERERDKEKEKDKDKDKEGKGNTPPSVRDWNTTLTGSGGTASFSVGHIPAKFVFDVNQPPSCTNDFVVTGTGLAGSATQASVVAYNNLYSNPSGTGFCSGTGPKVMWAYNLATNQIRHAAVLSLDGTRAIFVDAAGGFHVVRWSSATGNGTAVGAPATLAATTPGATDPGGVIDWRIAAGLGVTSPFVDYTADVAYVTTGTGVVRKIANVFKGIPSEVTTGGWPVTLPGGVTNLSTPVYDFNSKRVYVTVNGTIYFIDTTQATVSASATTWAFATAAASYPVIVDSTNQKVYAWSPSNGSNAVVAQADTALSAGSRVTASVGGTASQSPLGGDFNNAYYSGNATSARLYVVGNDATGTSTTRVPAFYMFSFDSAWKLLTTATGGPLRLATAAAEASYVTGFFNSTQNKDYMFVGVTTACSTAVTGGCIRSIDVSGSTFPTAANVNNVILAANGGTYGIAVDNNSSAAEASSVYYVMRSTNSLVKATQSALQ
ncbi:MAG: hypothetical protein U0Q16_22720 [Bryobacteraceae bacterium]